jgi:hypothetical protein
MTPNQWERLKDVYAEACDLPADGRRAFVEAEPDPEVRAEAIRLLEFGPSRPAMVDTPAVDPIRVREVVEGFRPLERGEVLAGRFEIRDRIGSGGMGDVYTALDRELETVVAIKTVRPDLLGDARISERFKREVQLARQVTHPNICRVHDWVRAEWEGGGEITFLTMEYVEGRTLAGHLCDRGPMTLAEARPLILQIVQALGAAHAAGVVHRDLKSANILLAGPRVVITDFGLARPVSSSGHSGPSAWGLGTPAYMAPEQVEGKPVGPAADIYALGVVMYEMATGRPPYQVESPLEMVVRKIKEPPEPPSRHHAIDAKWEAVILKCLAYRPEDRFQKAEEIASALDSGVWPVRRWTSLWKPAAVSSLLAALIWVALQWKAPARLTPEAERWYREGVAALSDGAYPRARDVLLRAVEAAGSFAPARCRLAEAYLDLQAADLARQQVTLARKASGDRLLAEACEAMVSYDWDRAMTALGRRAASAAPESKVDALLDVARMAERKYRLGGTGGAGAVSAYQEVLKLDASHPGALLRIAGLKKDVENQTAEATALLERAEAAFDILKNREGIGEVALVRGRLETNASAAEERAKRADEIGAATGSDWLRVRALLARSGYRQRQGDGEGAANLARQAMDLAEATGQLRLVIFALTDLGSIYSAQRMNEEAEEALRQALALAERQQDGELSAYAKLRLSPVLIRSRRVDEGSRLAREATDYYDSRQRPADALRARLNLSTALLNSNRIDEAKAGFLDALPRAVAMDQPATVLLLKYRLGYLIYLQGEYPEAIPYLKEAAEGYAARGDRNDEQFMRLRLATSNLGIGRFAEAEAELNRLNAPPGLANALRKREWISIKAALDTESGRETEAVRAVEQLAEETRRTEPERLKSMASQLCAIYAVAGRTAQAEKICAEAVPGFRDAKSHGALSSVLCGLAEAKMFRGRYSEAVPLLEEAREVSLSARNNANALYAVVLETDALDRLGRTADRDRVMTIASADIGEFQRRWGVEVVKSYLKRPPYWRRLERFPALRALAEGR